MISSEEREQIIQDLGEHVGRSLTLAALEGVQGNREAFEIRRMIILERTDTLFQESDLPYWQALEIETTAYDQENAQQTA